MRFTNPKQPNFANIKTSDKVPKSIPLEHYFITLVYAMPGHLK